jgi:hypothetical protein
MLAMTADDFRRLALGMAGAVESAHMGHPDFRANGRIFASLQADDQRGMVKLTPEEQRECMRADPRMFVPATGAWGRQGCTMVQFELADEATVRGAVLLAWQHVMDGPRRPQSAARPARRRPRATRVRRN